MVKTVKRFGDSSKILLKELPIKARDIVERRFGIGNNSKRQTLESIGENYNITRERVRQIEAASINKIRSSAAFASLGDIFSDMEKEFTLREKIWREDEVLAHFVADEKEGNYIYFFLSIAEPFKRLGESVEFYHRWTSDLSTAVAAEKAIRNFCATLSEDLMSRDEMEAKFKRYIEVQTGRKLTVEAVFAWLAVSKNIDSNYFGEWGHADSPLVRPSGMRDFAYLILKKHGSPLHFTEVASYIYKLTDKKAHVQTVHNELIKDDRFVLVGRGLYALSDWGYQAGTVKDIIKYVLAKNGPVSKDELIKMVKQERYVKENTIFINLQNKADFKKLPDGRFNLA